MYTSINHNMMAANTARNLNTHYGNLATSTQRLSSGLRINGASDDAAGLAIRELMRADIAAYNQGIRNANDAISMIQVVDGALGIIDEKLIRMKELAEQAATGTYDSTQRLMIDSEFQAMASEIQRIATATDFNGIKLIDSVDKLGLSPGVELNVPFIKQIDVTRNETQRDYNFEPTNQYNYYSSVSIEDAKIHETGEQQIEYYFENDKLYKKTINNINIETQTSGITCNLQGITYGAPKSITRVQNTDMLDYIIDNLAPANYFTIDYFDLQNMIVDCKYEYFEFAGSINHNFMDCNHKYTLSLNIIGDDQTDMLIDIFTEAYQDIDDIKRSARVFIDATKQNDPMRINNTINNRITIEEMPLNENAGRVTIHFDPMNDSAEDYYDIEKRDCTLKGLGLKDVRIEAQDKAQEALVTINDAIVKKDQARAYYGAMQNRLENTVSNLTIQSENLQASESRISDVDVATEMTNFVRNQILTQSAVAMLSQANSMPQMAMQLIGG